jgi:hypothetical protein
MNDDMCWTFSEIAGWLELIAEGDLSLDEALQVRSPQDLPPHRPQARPRR